MVVNAVVCLKVRPLLEHTAGDDNVHMENPLRLFERRIGADNPFSPEIYPSKIDLIAGQDMRVHLRTSILARFEEHLKAHVAEGAGQ